MKVFTGIVAAALLLTGLAQADVVAQYGFADTAASTDAEANTTAGAFSVGIGASAWSYSGLGQPPKSAYFFNDGFNQTTRTGAIAFDDYLYFTVGVGAGYAADYAELSFYTSSDVTAGAGAPDSYSVFTSQNGYATSVGTDIGGIVSEGNSTFKKHTINLSGFAELQSVTDSTEFRIYLWTTDGIAGSNQREFRVDTVVLEGTVIPEPATIGMFGFATTALLFYRRRFS